MAAIKITSVIDQLKEALLNRYGVGLKRVILFGSQARGTSGPGSDIDVLVLLDHPDLDPFQEYRKWSEWVVETMMQSGELVNLIFSTPDRFESVKSPLYLNIHQEGIVVYEGRSKVAFRAVR